MFSPSRSSSSREVPVLTCILFIREYQIDSINLKKPSRLSVGEHHGKSLLRRMISQLIPAPSRSQEPLKHLRTDLIALGRN